MAVMEARSGATKMENKQELARSSATPAGSTSAGRHHRPLKGDINYGNGRVATATGLEMKFWKDHASYPFKSHDAWFLTENIRWGKCRPTDVKALVDKVNREDLWRDAAKGARCEADIPA
jgi:nitrate/nitrite transport system substrate-binding protein